jgi:hypothetical protein
VNEFTVHEFLESLREGPYTSYGCYPLFWLTSDGESLSHKACLRNALTLAREIRDGGQGCVVACDVNWEDPYMYCADTNERIPSAYADDVHDSNSDV